jgi:hypothetical protein
MSGKPIGRSIERNGFTPADLRGNPRCRSFVAKKQSSKEIHADLSDLCSFGYSPVARAAQLGSFARKNLAGLKLPKG